MPGRLDGKVAFITGAARGQGRAHAIAMAKEGADIIAIDICRQIDSNPYPLATPDDLAETERSVKELGRRSHRRRQAGHARGRRTVVHHLPGHAHPVRRPQRHLQSRGLPRERRERYITGQQIRVDAGSLLKWPKGPGG
jgi:hypothetical protein